MIRLFFSTLTLACIACSGSSLREEPEEDDGYVESNWKPHVTPTVPPCEESECGVTKGLVGDCESGFMHGLNYAWREYGGDFGGWGRVSDHADEIRAQFQDLSTSGINVVRWWIFPSTASGAIQFDAEALPTGVSAEALEDVNAALAIAAETNMSIQPTLFTFNNYDRVGRRNSVNLHNTTVSEAGRAMMVENVVRPLLLSIQASPNADRIHSWDVMNEPEWSITPPAPYGAKAFTPQDKDIVEFADMELFVLGIVHELHLNSDAPVTVGSSSPKWVAAWQHVGLDFYTVHIYGTDDAIYPWGTRPENYGLDKPVVLGEFPLSGLGSTSYDAVASTAFDLGYIGVMGWAMNDRCCGSWTAERAQVEAFTQAKNCQ
jgi:hypothetical protein